MTLPPSVQIVDREGRQTSVFLNYLRALEFIDGEAAQAALAALIALGVPSEGQWTPTLTIVSNLDAVAPFPCNYTQIGNTVMCWGQVAADPTLAANTLTRLRMSLPVPSNFTATTEAMGNASTQVAQRGGAISSDIATDTAVLTFASEVTTSTVFAFSFSYRILP